MAALVLMAGPARAAYGAAPHSLENAQGMSPSNVRAVTGWIIASGDNLELPFLIVDKVHAQVLAFAPDGSPRGSAAILIGLTPGDATPADIGQRKLAQIGPKDRITPAGRFLSAIGNDLGTKDVLWIDYPAGLSMHRVVHGAPTDHRRKRLASGKLSDKRISYGCINVPAAFFDKVIDPLLKGGNAMVYILPETKSWEAILKPTS